jgi:hypothetical protein
MFAVPDATAVTMPVVAPIVAMLVLPLLQVPPAVALLSIVVPPIQATSVPVIGATVNGFTESILVVEQKVEPLV